jgi:hypothetical protein
MDFQNMQTDDEEQPREEEQQQPQKRLDARPKNNIYAPGTGPGTGRTAIRVGTINRDGSTSPVSALGAATGPLSQPLPRFSADQLQQMKDTNSQGFGTRPGRIDARPRNNIYMPGTGPGTGRTAIRVGTINRDGSTSPVSGLGAATGPLSQPTSRFMTPRPTPADAFAQRQGNVANAKANGTFDAAREKFNAANPGHIMDEQGNISKNPNAPPPTKFDQVPDGLGGYKMVPVPPKNTPAPGAAATAGQPGTIKTGTGQFGKSAQSMEMPKPAPLVPPVIGSPVKLPPTPAESPIAPPVTASSAPSSSLGMPGAGTLGASSQQFGSPSSTAPATSSSTASTPAESPTAPPATSSSAPSSLGMPGTGTLGASSQQFGSLSSTAPATPAAESSPESKEPEEDNERNNEGGDEEDNENPTPRAKGGPVKAGKPYLVGEKGPEIIVPKHSGTVVPNHALKNARQTRGLFMQPRPVPAAYFQQMTRGLRAKGGWDGGKR